MHPIISFSLILRSSSSLAAISILMQLQPISPPLSIPSISLSNSTTSTDLNTTSKPPPVHITQKCTSLPPNHCCIPIDISETSHTTDRQRFALTALDFQSNTSDTISIWASTTSSGVRDCEGPAAARLTLKASKESMKYSPKEGVRISGFGLGEQEEKEVLFPSVVNYKGGVYWEYIGGRLVYARVSYWGDGPNIIYGMRQQAGEIGRGEGENETESGRESLGTS